MSIENRQAHHNYEIIETYQCGMVLESWEVKAIVNGTCSIAGSYCKILSEEVFLVGANMGSSLNEMQRTRKLLLNRREINKLIGKTQERGFALVPLKIYPLKGKFKLLIGLAKGKKEYDKRETDKKRSIEDDNRRIIKSQKFAE
jgi:SsrA-binding protein